MVEARVERRLAAILAADVAGYSRLMGVDEEGTLAALKAYRRELIDPKIAEHRGRIVKTTGDGALVEFASAVDAVRCAMEIQSTMAERNTAVPEDRRIEFRIGINVGDIIIDEGDIYGDGVNIAARVETIASLARFAFRTTPTSRSRESLYLMLATWASSNSRTLRSRSGSTVCDLKTRLTPVQFSHCPVSPPLRCCHLRT
jgi:adenylate cyclase